MTSVLRARASRALAILALLGLAHLAFAIHASRGLLWQERANLTFVAQSCFLEAISSYPATWPPLYPIVLALFDRLDVSPTLANELLFLLSLFLVGCLARRVAPSLSSLIPVTLYAVMQANYVTLNHAMAEALFVPLALTCALALSEFRRRQSWRNTLWLAAPLAALGLTRYFGIFWLVTLVAGESLWRARRDLRGQASRLVMAASLVLAPVAAWMAHAYATTGFLSGSDRLSPRDLPKNMQHWIDSDDLGHHLWFSAKTYVADFLSPIHRAGHSFIFNRWVPSEIEWLCMLVALAASVVIVGSRWRGGPETPLRRAWSGLRESLPAQLFGLYLGWTLFLWTMTNSDQIYTRFLYPSYVFLILALCRSYASLPPDRRVARHAFVVLAVLFFSVQLYKTLLPIL